MKDTKFYANLRTYFVNRNNFDATENEAWAIGGWAGLKTGYFFDHLSLGLTGYTSLPLYAPDDKDGSLLLKPGGKGYAVLGEAYADLRISKDLNVYAGRREPFNTPYLNSNDFRMTPNTFEAIELDGQIELGKGSADPSKDGAEAKTGVLRYGVGYFNRMKGNNSDEFVSMSTVPQLGANVERGVYTAKAIYEKGKVKISGYEYFSPDIINIAYAEAILTLPIDPDWEPKLYAQFTDQRSVGDELLTGSSFSGQAYGIKAMLPAGNAQFSFIYTTVTDGTDMRFGWSYYPGYHYAMVNPYFRAGESVYAVKVNYNFTRVPGLSAFATFMFGTEPSRLGQYRTNEYDYDVQWNPPEGVLKGLAFRLRYSWLKQFGGGDPNEQDFRIILNYPF